MVVFAFVLALFHNHQGVGVIFDTGGQSLTVSTFLVAMFMSLYVTLRWVHPRWHTPIGAASRSACSRSSRCFSTRARRSSRSRP